MRVRCVCVRLYIVWYLLWVLSQLMHAYAANRMMVEIFRRKDVSTAVACDVQSTKQDNTSQTNERREPFQ